MVVESLEKRQLLSATVELEQDGVLRISGSDADDVIQVMERQMAPGEVVVSVGIGPDGPVDIVVAPGADSSDPAFTGVTGVRISGKDGSDQITFEGYQLSALIDGGLGGDTIDISDNDTGSSAARGGNGSDELIVQRGNSTVLFGGNDGDQFLFMGQGSVYLFGGNGDDIFTVTGGGEAYVFGGNGDDVALLFDECPTVVEVETTTTCS